jgi:hypothetical protein
MNNKMPFFKADQAGCVLGAVFLLTLTGCVGYVEGPRAGVPGGAGGAGERRVY